MTPNYSNTDTYTDIECAICFSDQYQFGNIKKKSLYITSCGHTFHNNCLRTWCVTNNSCPNCRTPHIIDNIDNVLQKHLESRVNYTYNSVLYSEPFGMHFNITNIDNVINQYNQYNTDTTNNTDTSNNTDNTFTPLSSREYHQFINNIRPRFDNINTRLPIASIRPYNFTSLYQYDNIQSTNFYSRQ